MQCSPWARSSTVPMASFTDLYPERRGGVVSPTAMQRATGYGNPQHLRTACEQNLLKNIQEMPMVKTLLSALQSSGCPVDLTRHLSCEMCQPGQEVQHAGGYDPALNQVFICSNNATSRGAVHGALVRNLIHMFDTCVNRYEPNSPRHLACTEVRKANLANCQFLSAMSRQDASFGVSGQQAACVRSVAVESLVKTQFLREEVASRVVDEVFDSCYADMEPIGRRAKNTDDLQKANEEKFLFGYS